MQTNENSKNTLKATSFFNLVLEHENKLLQNCFSISSHRFKIKIIFGIFFSLEADCNKCG